MANYECITKSNDFRIKDEKAFLDFMNQIYAEDLYVDESYTADNGDVYYEFGAYGIIAGLPVTKTGELTTCDADDCDDYNYDFFIGELQKHVAEDDCIILTEIGNEKLRYVGASSVIITCDDIEFCNLNEYSEKIAKELLNKKKLSTENK